MMLRVDDDADLVGPPLSGSFGLSRHEHAPRGVRDRRRGHEQVEGVLQASLECTHLVDGRGIDDDEGLAEVRLAVVRREERHDSGP